MTIVNDKYKEYAAAFCKFKLVNSSAVDEKIDVLLNDSSDNVKLVVLSDTLNIRLKKNADIGLVKMQFSSPDFLFLGFYINGEKFLYSQFFSSFQYKSDMVDIPIGFSINEDTILEFEMPAKSDAVISLYPSKIYRDNNNRKLINVISGSYKPCVILENKTDSTLLVNILDGMFYPNGCNTEELNFEVALCDQDFIDGHEITGKLIRTVSYSFKQIGQDLKQDENIIHSHNYVSPYQFQASILDIPRDFNIKKGGLFEVIVLPRTKVMYQFM